MALRGREKDGEEETRLRVCVMRRVKVLSVHSCKNKREPASVIVTHTIADGKERCKRDASAEGALPVAGVFC